jgi:Uma2 family endonuclease
MTIALEKKTNTLSLEEFLTLPETKPASEYIDNQIHQKPMPQAKHSTLQSEMIMAINQRAKPKQLAYAFPELRCTFARRSIVPDISVFEWANIPLDDDGETLNKIQIPPDWMIEILSPAQSPFLIIEKIGFALKHGTKLGWLIAPKERHILTFREHTFHSHHGMDILPMLEIFEDWQLSVQDVFNLLKFV